ncbi:hypothetical protein B0A50_02314 [Salinomyces thailandicus]|uniref:HAUS augmin-like complex subunit 6 N-terminal domain-containing protein n=1 Tax=Salinomyces thailandicus TaxID=706561 RepID=A0A4U0U8T0_9PEZI|nr:hypothetical protein B0A50_02314 [Salinomyces thailandica]
MERPMSRDMAGLGHRRNPSTTTTTTTTTTIKTTPKSTSPAVISLFVINLRLLNFDLLPDWPGISPTSFNNQGTRPRIRSTEFALYHLFKVYDPATAADKLQPFYPPLEPLQSVNLRAALYRCLDGLKKNGVLGREVVLRKSMLDECSGDKLWEVCLAFSAIVLRQAVLKGERKRNASSIPVAERWGTATGLRKDERDSMLSLSIAHRASLGQALQGKQRKKQAFARLYDVLCEKEAELTQRKAQVQQTATGLAEQVASVDAIEQSMKKTWLGNKELQKALVNGDVSAGRDAVLKKPLDKLARSSDEIPSTEQGLLENLSHSATRQSQRVRKWQSMHEDLLAKKQTSRPDSIPELGRPDRLRFDQHRSLSLRDAPQLSPNRLPPGSSKPEANITQYDDILTTMREELRRNRRNATSPERAGSSNQVSTQQQQQPVRNPSYYLDAVSGAPDTHKRSPSETAVPMRPSMARRASSRSKSYQQPKVEGMRQHIPLKSEIFSPLKLHRRGSASPLAGDSLVASPVEEEAPATGAESDETASYDDRHSGRQSVEAYEKVDSGVGLGISDEFPVDDKKPLGQRRAEPPGNNSNKDRDDDQEDTKTPSQQHWDPSNPPPLNPPPHKLPATLCLADRTRASMAPPSSSTTPISSPRLPSPSSPVKTATPSDLIVVETLEERDGPIPSLADRARHTIAQAPAPPLSHHTKPSLARTQSSFYPTNQFSTPEKQQEGSRWRASSTVATPADLDHSRADDMDGYRRGPGGVDNGRPVTPPENLFEPGAEYDSVFKARPRVKMSPVESPSRHGDEEAGRVEE